MNEPASTLSDLKIAEKVLWHRRHPDPENADRLRELLTEQGLRALHEAVRGARLSLPAR